MELKPREIRRASPVERGTVMITRRKVFFYGLQEIRIVQHIGIIIKACPEIGLGGEIIPLLRGIDEHVNQRINHKYTEK